MTNLAKKETKEIELKGRVINIFDGFDEELLKETMALMLKWEEEDRTKIEENARLAEPEKDIQKLLEPVTINIISPGGFVYVCMAIVDMLKSLKCKIITRCLGMACSAGFYLFCIGDERIAGPNTELMYHPMSYIDYGKLQDIIDYAKFQVRMQAKLDALVTEKTNVTQEMLDKYKKEDCWMTCEDALDMNVATGTLY